MADFLVRLDLADEGVLAAAEALAQRHSRLTCLPLDNTFTIAVHAAVSSRQDSEAKLANLRKVAVRSARPGMLPKRMVARGITDARVWTR
jgi:hypothetical protein